MTSRCSNIVALRRDETKYIILWGVENILIIYEYDNGTMSTKKLKNEDMHSEVSTISLDEESESVFISLENKKLYRMQLSDLKLKKITETPLPLLQIEVSSRFVVMLHENHTMIVRDLEKKEKLESLGVRNLIHFMTHQFRN